VNAAELHRDALVVDCHNDLVMSLALQQYYPERGTLRHRWIPELREGGVNVQVVPIYVEPEVPEGALRVALQNLQLAVDEAEANSEAAAICTSGLEIAAAVGSGRIALVLALEGFSQFATDLGLVRTFHRLGVRMISFTHFGRTLLADGTAEDAAGSRLTSMGVQVLSEMERLGILMDVSHLGIRGVEHVLEIARRPVIASHSNARVIWDHHRNLSDEHLAAIGATGGVIGLNVVPLLVDGREPTMERLMEHLDHMIEIAGIDHVGLGPDFIRDIYNEMLPPDADVSHEGYDGRSVVEGLANATGLPRITEAMLDRGYAEADIRKVLGTNFQRVFDAVMGRPIAG
jgi:membrane dipeptidase